MRYLILILMALVIFPLASAIEVNKGDSPTISFECIDRVTEGFCSGNCNLSLKDVNGIEINRTEKALDAGLVEITYAGDLFPDVGSYEVMASCTNGTYSSFDSQDIVVKESTSNNFMLFLIVGGLAIFLTILAILIKDEWVGAFGGILFVGLGLYGLVNGIDVYKNSTTGTISLLLALFGVYVILQAALEKIG